MTITEDKVVGEIVAEDYRTASIFQSFGIDFCCKGNRTIDEACAKENIDSNVLLSKLNEITQQHNNKMADFQSWPLDLLADYIEKKHHRYVDEKIPVIKQYLDKICQVHGKQHPELFEIAQLFQASAGELTTHMKKEEFILFPYIRKMISTKQKGEPIVQPHFGTVQNPVQMMMHEHDTEGERFRKISELSNHYAPPQDACNTYCVTLALLKEFDEDLHLHIHLENNILFPKAIAIEKQLA